MKAVLCKAYGPASSLVLEETTDPVAKKNEVVIDIHAAGVNFPDTLIIEGKYQVKPPFPFSPGGEAAGVVASVGESVKHLKVGDRVMGLTGFGSFAEKVATDAMRVLPMPDDMDYVISLCQEQELTCPTFPATVKVLAWPTPDPVSASGQKNEIREFFTETLRSIEQKIIQFQQELSDN